MAWRARWTICNSHLWTNERVSQKRNAKYHFESVSFSVSLTTLRFYLASIDVRFR